MKVSKSDAIPAQTTVLSVSWLNRQVKAVAVHRGVIEGTWECPREVEPGSSFDAILREAVQQTGYRGIGVSVLLTYPRLVQQIVDLPPAKGAILDKLIQRQTQQQKFFPGEAAWACQPSVSTKEIQRVILHLFPRTVLEQLIQACRRNNLHLMSVMPPSAVLQQQIKRLSLEKDEAALLAAETGGSTTVLIGRGDGQVLLARTLPGTWNENAERLALDLNRTVLFANEQYGAALHQGIWLFGQGAPEQAETIQHFLQAPARVTPVEFTPFYWAGEAPKLRSPPSPNFISPKLQKAPQRRAFATAMAAVVALVLLLSLGGAAFLYFQAHQETASIKTLSEQLARLETKHKELQQRHLDLERKQRALKLVVDGQSPPVPVWFLGYLSEVVPSEMVVTNLSVKREESVWKVRLAGGFQKFDKPPPPGRRSAVVAALTAQLANGPFHLSFSDPEKEKEASTHEKARATDFGSWVAKLAASRPATNSIETDHFSIEGFIQ